MKVILVRICRLGLTCRLGNRRRHWSRWDRDGVPGWGWDRRDSGAAPGPCCPGWAGPRWALPLLSLSRGGSPYQPQRTCPCHPLTAPWRGCLGRGIQVSPPPLTLILLFLPRHHNQLSSTVLQQSHSKLSWNTSKCSLFFLKWALV